MGTLQRGPYFSDPKSQLIFSEVVILCTKGKNT